MGANAEKDLSYKLIFEIDNFSGPLDLLLKLIRTQKIDINDIPIVQITSQFLDFINRFGDQLFDRLGDYLVMASKLTLIKAKMLLPTKKEAISTEDPREDLKKQLLAYDRFIKIGDVLKSQKEKHQIHYSREEIFASQWDQPALKEGAVSIEQLVTCMEKIISSQGERQQVFNLSRRLNISLAEVNQRIQKILRLEKQTTFSHLAKEFATIDGVVACFVELLTLMHLNKIKVTQKEEFGELFLELSNEF